MFKSYLEGARGGAGGKKSAGDSIIYRQCKKTIFPNQLSVLVHGHNEALAGVLDGRKHNHLVRSSSHCYAELSLLQVNTREGRR